MYPPCLGQPQGLPLRQTFGWGGVARLGVDIPCGAWSEGERRSKIFAAISAPMGAERLACSITIAQARAEHRALLKWGTAHHPETEKVVTVDWKGVVAGGRAREVLVVAPRTAAHHAPKFAGQVFKAVIPPIRLICPPRLAPFPDVAAHILCATYGRAVRERADGRCSPHPRFI